MVTCFEHEHEHEHEHENEYDKGKDNSKPLRQSPVCALSPVLEVMIRVNVACYCLALRRTYRYDRGMVRRIPIPRCSATRVFTLQAELL